MSTVQAWSPPEPPPSRTRRLLLPGSIIAGLGAATVALHLRDPHASGSWGFCPSAEMGVFCPGCGGLRAVNDLTNGQVVDAASSNLLLVLAMPFAIFFLARWALDAWRGVRRRPQLPAIPLLVAVGMLTLTFVILRNIPAGSWLAP